MSKTSNQKNSKTKLICDTICGALMLISILVYIILGITISWWHPGWIIIVGAAIADGIISLISNMICSLKNINTTEQTNNTNEN